VESQKADGLNPSLNSSELAYRPYAGRPISVRCRPNSLKLCPLTTLRRQIS